MISIAALFKKIYILKMNIVWFFSFMVLFYILNELIRIIVFVYKIIMMEGCFKKDNFKKEFNR